MVEKHLEICYTCESENRDEPLETEGLFTATALRVLPPECLDAVQDAVQADWAANYWFDVLQVLMEEVEQ